MHTTPHTLPIANTLLTHALPADAGIPSDAVYRFIKKLEDCQIPMHSILLARHGRLVTEAYYSPYDASTLHRMFSVSKSFTSVAVGLMAEEGRLSLDDPIINYFPDKVPEKVHPWIAQMTIRHMLKMETCRSVTTYKLNRNKDWVESFFTTEPSHEPGTVFYYDTSASHTLCALVERLAGRPMLDYMRDRCLDQLGFSKEAYMLRDPFGVSMGGSGLMATPMDLMIFAMLVMNGGSMKGTQYLPKWYVDAAVSCQTSTLVTGSALEECQGYGYQFWRTRQEGFACYGMGGQLAICLPKQDLICVTTADTQGIQGGNQMIYHCLYEEILPYLSDTPLPADSSAQARLEEYLSRLCIQPLQGGVSSPRRKELHARSYHLAENPAGFTGLSLEFAPDGTEGVLLLTCRGEVLSLPFGFGRTVTGSFPIYSQRCASSGCWLSQDLLYIKSHIIDEAIGSVRFQLAFRENTVTVYMKKVEEHCFNEFTGYLHGTAV
ncbi:serine hydrolase domain-containing protein [Anaerotaenia torta]|uniref:serine hydrolase domain-containing protein n=1 Tax=Anaerotaenia torta TaxID=433293 RepID=UPI003D246D50